MIGKRGHYFIIRPINKLYLLEIQNLDNSFVRNSSENDDVIDESRANRPEQLAGEKEGPWFDNWINKNKIEWLNDFLQTMVMSVEKEPSICFKEYAQTLF